MPSSQLSGIVTDLTAMISDVSTARPHVALPLSSPRRDGVRLARILTIEDDASIASAMSRLLGDAGFSVDWCASGRDGLSRAIGGQYDAITIDRMLPDLDGIKILSTLRTLGISTPVMMVSALGDADERVRGLRAGGDDYLSKPFDSEELCARVEVLLRHKHRVVPEKPTHLTAGPLTIDLIERKVRRSGLLVSLLPTEYRLLEYMARHPGQTLTRTNLFESVWGYHFDPGTNLIDVHMGRLRRKIDPPGLPPVIVTVRGAGYRLA